MHSTQVLHTVTRFLLVVFAIYIVANEQTPLSRVMKYNWAGRSNQLQREVQFKSLNNFNVNLQVERK